MSPAGPRTWVIAFWRFILLAISPWAKVYTAVTALIGLASLLGVAAITTFLPELKPYRWQILAGVLFIFVFAAGVKLQEEKDQARALPRLAVDGMSSGKGYAMIEVTNTRSSARSFTAQLLKAGNSTRRRSLSWGIGGSRPEKVEILPQLSNQLTIGQVSVKPRQPPGQGVRLRVMRPRNRGSDYTLDMPGGRLDVAVRISASDGEVTDVHLEIRKTGKGAESVIAEQMPIA